MEIIRWFEKNDIKYAPEGKNVGKKGWVNIQCLFCPDYSNHLGISPTGGYHCWSCGKKGGLTEIVRHFEHCSWKQANEIAKSLLGFEIAVEKPKTKWPPVSKEPLQIHRKYVKSRGLDIRYLIEKYNVRFTGQSGIDRLSLFAPMTESYVLADCTRNRVHYIKGENAEKCIYNIERVKTNRVFLVEGLIDCWSFDSDKSDTVSALGTNLTHAQILALSKFDRITILFDSDATTKAVNLACQLDGLVNGVVVYDYRGWVGDPGDMDREQKTKVRKECG
jgi:hypothetical protein